MFKTLYCFLITIALLFVSTEAWSQCANNNTLTTNSPSTVMLSGPGDTVRNSCISMGEYALLEVCGGVIYHAFTCETPEVFPIFDTHITVYEEGTGDTLVWNDDFCGLNFGFHAFVSFTAQQDGFVRILIDNQGCDTPLAGCIILGVTQVTACCDTLDIDVFNVSCNGANDGKIIATGTDNGPWDYEWRFTGGALIKNLIDVFGADSISGLGPGNYTVAVTDTSFCTRTENVVITEPAAINPSINGLSQGYCSDEAPVTLTPSPSGGTLTGTGLVGNVFNPALADTGYNDITYVVTVAGCTDSVTLRTYVTTFIKDTASITASPNPACPGDSITFIAVFNLRDAAPAFQWQINGVNIGPNSGIWKTDQAGDGDTVRIIYSSQMPCSEPDTSNEIIITTTIRAVDVTVTVNKTSVCDGDSLTFQANPINGGVNPQYQWLLNGSVVTGAINSSYVSDSFKSGDLVTVILTSSDSCAINNPDTSVAVTVPVINRSPVSVSISVDVNPSCDGDTLTFTASPVNGGSNPSYQWQVNGNNIGPNSSQVSTDLLSDGDVVTVILTSSDTCITNNPDTSNSITINTVIPLVVSVTALASDDSICAGELVTFTASGLNGGASASYQWQLNGINVGTNDSIYSNNTLADGDSIRVIYSTSLACTSNNPDSSAYIVIHVEPQLPVSVVVSASNNPICAGDSVTFIASGTNTGDTPTWQWQLNGVNIGSNDTILGLTGLNNGDELRIILNSSLSCVSNNPDTSVAIVMNVVSPQPVSVSISGAPNPVCAGDAINFSAIAVNGGTSPSYQWQVNGVDVGTNSASYNASGLNSGDLVRVILTSSDTCVSNNPDTSNAISVIVLVPSPVSVSVSADSDTICLGETVTFTATPVNGGVSPGYQWQINNSNAGSSTTVFSSSNLQDGDVVQVILTSSDTCVSNNPDTSNLITIVVQNAPSPLITEPSGLCDGELYPLSVDTFNSYLWNDGSTQQSLPIDNAGTYSITVTDENGCTGIDTIILGSLNYVEIGASAIAVPDEIVEGESTDLSASPTGNYSYSWVPVSTLDDPLSDAPVATPDVTTTYTVIITDLVNGCIDSATVIVTVEKINAFVIPDVFSPNGDGKNDYFQLVSRGTIDINEFIIYNRWGQDIYNSNAGMWDGKFEGKDQPLGSYVLQLVVKHENGTLEKHTQPFTLIR